MTDSHDEKNNKNETIIKSPKNDKIELIKDIKGESLVDRSQMGVVELTLEEGTQVKAYGIVYGLEHSISGKGYSAHLMLDHYNQRIKVQDYEASNFFEFLEKIEWIAEANGFDKIIFMAFIDDWQRFLCRGYVLEAILRYYHNGEDAFVVSKFGSQNRFTSHVFYKEVKMIEKILSKEPDYSACGPPKEFDIRFALKSDTAELVEMYRKIFDSYPSPLLHEDYLSSVFQKENLFVVATQNNKVVAAASAELNVKKQSAELTDCATLSEFRGQGLMRHLLSLLESHLKDREFICAYTMSRARSFGMNNAFYQLNYEFNGRLINNCDIFGAYEDMNIWVKKLVG